MNFTYCLVLSLQEVQEAEWWFCFRSRDARKVNAVSLTIVIRKVSSKMSTAGWGDISCRFVNYEVFLDDFCWSEWWPSMLLRFSLPCFESSANWSLEQRDSTDRIVESSDFWAIKFLKKINIWSFKKELRFSIIIESLITTDGFREEHFLFTSKAAISSRNTKVKFTLNGILTLIKWSWWSDDGFWGLLDIQSWFR